MLSQGLVLLPHQVGIIHLLITGGEVAMPKQGGFFQERCRRIPHPIEPPESEREHLLALSPEKILSDFDPLLIGGSGLHLILRLDPLCGLHQRRPWKKMTVILGLGLEEVIDRTITSLLIQSIDFSRCPAEPRPVQQMGG